MIYNEQYFNGKFALYNKLYFGGELKTAKIGFNKTKSYLGYYKYKDGVHHITISMYYIRTERAYCTTLIHEMIHQYISQKKIKDTSVHGRQFKRIAARLQAYGWVIKVYNKTAEDLGIIGLNVPQEKKYIGIFTLPNGTYWTFGIAPSRVQFYIDWFKKEPQYFIEPYIVKTDNLKFQKYPANRRGVNGWEVNEQVRQEILSPKNELVYSAKTDRKAG